MVYSVTLDGGLLREHTLLPAVRKLKDWAAQGKIRLFETDRADDSVSVSKSGWPGEQRARPSRGHRSLKKMDSAGASFQRIAAVLFPVRDPNRLSMTEINDVTHLLRHHSLGHSLFVTTNERNFISEGKRERLQAAFNIAVVTPDEAVRFLTASESWSETASPERRG